MAIGMRTAAVVICIMTFLVLGGCASSTLIESRPAGATVILDGERMVGETPVRVRDLPWIGASRDYQFTKDGYYPRVIEINAQRNPRHMAACACTVGMMWPLLLFGTFPEEMVVELEREQPAPRAEFSTSPVVNFGPR